MDKKTTQMFIANSHGYCSFLEVINNLILSNHFIYVPLVKANSIEELPPVFLKNLFNTIQNNPKVNKIKKKKKKNSK